MISLTKCAYLFQSVVGFMVLGFIYSVFFISSYISKHPTKGYCGWGLDYTVNLSSEMNVSFAPCHGLGLKTGRCINDTGTCEIHGWCPVEKSRTQT